MLGKISRVSSSEQNK